ncbi:type III secretion system chaperone [Hyphomicrobium sp. MC1]|uniref:type III secretion system chaperone n=1 Tax=Hyphomicrobium sp. (strain MC1) TaxID=717785 RepID=UPI000213F226|nr:type III secretion system chaperone [Hyphomicrobium sp. MC1]CCB66699.1 protein of unknown function [Hyphomicrobium sp. MC1]
MMRSSGLSPNIDEITTAMNANMLKNVNQLLEEFVAHAGLASLYLDDDGYAGLGVNEEFVSLMLDQANETLLLMAPVGEAPTTAEVYARLLDANLFFAETGGCTLARDPENEMIVLQLQLPLETLNVSRLETGLTTIAGVVVSVRQTLLSDNVGAATDVTESAGI